MIFIGNVDDWGKLDWKVSAQIKDALTGFKDKRIQIEIKEAKKNRSESQNAYLWGVVYPAALQGLKDLGNEGLSIDLVHRFFKDKFLERWRDIVVPASGEVYRVKTTTDLTTAEMSEYIENIARWCAEFLNVIIPNAE
jgi:predicted RNA-binding protein Jag